MTDFAEQFVTANVEAFEAEGFSLVSASVVPDETGEDTYAYFRLEPSLAAMRDAINPGHEIERKVVADHVVDETLDTFNEMSDLFHDD